MQTTQYWKPGETRPTGVDGDRAPGSGGGSGSGRKDGRRGGKKGSTAGEGSRRGEVEARNGREGGGGAKKKGRKGQGKGKQDASTGGIRADMSRAASKQPVAGPSQGLLAMKFMQRKVKADEAQKQQQDKRDKLDRDFSSSYAKRLKADRGNQKDRLVCRTDEQDPALVVVGRRSFGGFNAVAEAAYNACIRDIAAGERLGQADSGRGDEGGGISDAEMAERLGKNVRRAGRR
ncbi:unnamed protein product [Scytosiphon promiscuus]